MSVTTVVTGLGWMGTGVRSVQSGLREMLQDARQEVMLCAYSVSGGAGDILDEFEACLNRGVRFTGVINRFANQPETVQQYFLKLITSHAYCQIFSFSDPIEELHSKLIIIDRHVALVGSANLSMRGMKQNYELGVIIQGAEAGVLARCFDDLLCLSPVLPVVATRP